MKRAVTTGSPTNLNTANGCVGSDGGQALNLAPTATSPLRPRRALAKRRTGSTPRTASAPSIFPHTFTDNTDAVAGKTATLSFDIAKQDADGHTTSSAESFEFRIDDKVVAHINASELTNSGEMYHYSFRHQRLCQ